MTPQSWREKLRGQAYLVTMFLRAVAGGMFATFNQYLYRRVAASYTDDLASLLNVTGDDACGTTHVNTSSKEYQLYAKISEETAQWNIYLTLVFYIPIIIMVVLLGAYSDKVGRRFLFLLSCGSTVVKGVILCLVIRYELHLAFMLVAEFIESVTGGYSSIAIASFSYTSDQHVCELTELQKDNKEQSGTASPGDTEGGYDIAENMDNVTQQAQDDDNDTPTVQFYDKNRALRLLALECFNVASMGIIQLTNGYFIAYAGFLYVMLTATVIMIINVIYTFFVIKNVETQVKRTRSILEPFRIIRKAIRQPRKMSAFILCNLAVVLVCFGDGGILRTLPIYQMSPPFCWTSVEIGWFNSDNFFATLLAVPFFMLLRRTNLSESTMAGIGSTINAVGTSIYALANVYWWIFFVVPVLTTPGMLAFALTRTITSRLAGPEAHGAMFAFTSLVENIMYMIGSLTGSGIYEATVSKLHSAVFFYFASVYMCSGIVYFIETCIERHRSPYDTDEKVHVTSTDSATLGNIQENGMISTCTLNADDGTSTLVRSSEEGTVVVRF